MGSPGTGHYSDGRRAGRSDTVNAVFLGRRPAGSSTTAKVRIGLRLLPPFATTTTWPLPQDSTGRHSLHHLATPHTTISTLSCARSLFFLPAGSRSSLPPFSLRNRALFPALPKPYDPFTPGYLPSRTKEGWSTLNLELTLPVFFSNFTLVNSSAPGGQCPIVLKTRTSQKPQLFHPGRICSCTYG